MALQLFWNLYVVVYKSLESGFVGKLWDLILCVSTEFISALHMLKFHGQILNRLSDQIYFSLTEKQFFLPDPLKKQ